MLATCTRNPQKRGTPVSIVAEDETLAYLAGLLDGDGYFKIVKSPIRGGRWTYYHIQVGVQQLWPGEAVCLFARTFRGKMMKPMVRPGLRPMARCEIHTRKAEAALPRLLPYLLVKRPQALLLQELSRLKTEWDRNITHSIRLVRKGKLGARPREPSPSDRAAIMERLRSQLIGLHEGSVQNSGAVADAEKSTSVDGPHRTCGETLAYLAGIMDSDGSVRIERRNVKGMLAHQYRISVRASQVSPSPAIELMAKTFGGRVATRESKLPRHRDLACWSLHDKSAANAINALMPHLVVKRRQAELLLELRRRKSEGKLGLTEWTHRNRWQRPIRMRKRCYTPEQVAEFERLRREVIALHSGELSVP